VDSLAQKPSLAYDMVLTNPPFGKKSSITIINEEGEESKEALTYVRDDFWATRPNPSAGLILAQSCLWPASTLAFLLIFPSQKTPVSLR